MLTALKIEDHTRRGIKGMFTLLRHNRIRVEHLYCDNAAVKSIVYEHRRGKISWSAIDRFVRSNRGRVLCSADTQLPAACGYRRFDDRALSRRLCENAGLYLLGEIDAPHVKVALIDNSGERTALCAYLTADTDNLLVITRCPRLYLHEADRILEQRGAVVRVSTGGADLSDADLIIAPEPIDRALNCAADAVILSGEPPQVSQNAPVICGYLFELPEKYRSVKPPYLDDMYFASALYGIGGVHELGAEVFRRCYDGRVLHTRASLTQQLCARLAHREKSAGES